MHRPCHRPYLVGLPLHSGPECASLVVSPDDDDRNGLFDVALVVSFDAQRARETLDFDDRLLSSARITEFRF